MMVRILIGAAWYLFYKVLFFELCWQILSHDIDEGGNGMTFAC
jgi:hypothetical protein